MIIAVDFDGILCEDKFPDVGRPHNAFIEVTRKLIDAGHDVILWTCRVDDKLTDALAFCMEHQLWFHAVNDGSKSNIAQYGTNPRKIHADVYVDDRAAGFDPKEALHDLHQILLKTEDEQNGR